jgi:hypothetical protein
MMSLPSLLIAVLMQAAPAPELKDVLAAWTQRASSIDSAAVELTIERDARHPTFGLPAAESQRQKVRLLFKPDLRQLQTPRLTVVRRDGQTQAAESDPERARVEFRNVLLEEQLKGPQMVPKSEQASRIIEASGREHGQKLSPLDRLVAEAPLWSAHPLKLINPARLELQSPDNQSRGLRIIEKQSAKDDLELWIESRAPWRPIRIIQHIEKRPAWQIDLTWSPEESRFATRYFVQTINISGEALEFVDATLASVESPLPASSGIGQIGPNRDQAEPPNPVSVRMRSLARQALDSAWLPVAAIATCVLMIVGRSRRRPAVS